jgi:hypothetical protein
MSPSDSKAAESAQPINMIVGQPANTSSSPAIKPEKSTSYWSETPPQSSHNASQATEAMASQPTPPVSTEEAATNKCAICAEPANHRCGRCVEGLDMNGKKSPAFYCSQECQREHWAAHKIECKVAVDRTELYKIGSLLQWAFYDGRKAMWHEDIRKVKKIDDKAKLLVWRDKSKDYTSHIFSAFPDSLFDEERDKQAILAHEAPGVALVSGLLVVLLKGAHCLDPA